MPTHRRRLTCSVVVLLSLAWAGPVFAQGAQTYDLRPRFVAGSGARYEVWTLRQQSTTMSLTGAGTQTFGSRLEITGSVTWQVQQVKNDGSATCAMTLEYLTADLTLPDGSVQRNDSRQARGDTEALHGVLRAMAGVPLQVEVASDGSIAAVRGVEKIRQRAGGEDPPQDIDFVESASDLATLCGALPAATPGAAWDMDYAWRRDLGTLHQRVRYQLASVEEIEGIPVATVTASAAGPAAMRLQVDPAKLPAGGPRVEVRMTSASLQSQVMFDLARREAVGRNTVESRRVEMRATLEQRTLTRVMDEVTQGQALRVAEW